jgi:predicted dehydrogenase
VGAQPTADDMAIINDPSIDAISNTLPTHLHRKYTVAALGAGKHVLVEKPFGLTLADCNAMIAARDKSGKHLMVAHVLRFWPEYVALADFVKSGKLGKPLAAIASRLSVPPGWADWFKDPELSGGAVLDLMIHDIDALNWLLGSPKSIYARGWESRPGSWDHMHAVLDYGDSHAFVEASEFMPADYPFTMTLKVLCERGSVEFAFRAGGVSVEMGGGGTSLMVYEPGKAYKLEAKAGDAYEGQIAYFVDCIKANSPPALGTAEQGRLAVQLSLAARESLEGGKVVALKGRAGRRPQRKTAKRTKRR